ncbi:MULTISPECIES: methylation-associated defense system restriction endonuclease subunit S MAD5 [Nocardia]|uniref:methylation-associated defense system restriction endonuclease subunit S MAD5 n=2 Tax=Nocardiaceae TaxID=85025 RepID=UPI000BF2394C|nr:MULTISPECIES: restriction endonuclease subunit S [Nocardia]MBF6185120.1 restriction endonuclease subunit S [Nocardia farcinica]MBF6310956.1 restriction endonuclease subunit S [Nocardia farcinica]MBF6409892.1 restriction endonuclease subunit S [Nocardia farcinica]PEH77228.1 restriction endonuclease subunit S [Nocardia sp. FDAARGOS_372]UEX21739.1 restriction endonuclease subunit S [Nocardia farcinica]
MKVTSLDNPVKVEWFFEQGCRLDPTPYLSGALEARKRLEALPNTVRLDTVTDSIHHAGRFSRRWVQSPEHGIPFFSSTDILEADYSYLPYVAKSAAKENPRLLIRPRWTLVTRSGTVGRVAYARPDIDGFACSEDVMRIRPNEKNIPAGYLNTFLRSRFGIPMIVSSAYGAIIQHIEPHHLADLPVPRFDADLEQRIHDLVEEAAHLRADFQAGLNTATEDFFRSAGLPELIDYRWHEQERDLGFQIEVANSKSLRALNFSPRVRDVIDKLESVAFRRLGDICDGGWLGSGVRFKRIDADEEHGVQLIGQRQGFWARPEGRWISAAASPRDIFAPEETILIASQGTLGEHEVFCRSLIVYGSWTKHAYTQHFLRVVSGDSNISGAYLFAFFRSEVAFRILRSMSVGSKQQDIHEGLRREIPIPIVGITDRERIADTVRQAFRHRDRADVLEDEALDLLTKAIEGAEV